MILWRQLYKRRINFVQGKRYFGGKTSAITHYEPDIFNPRHIQQKRQLVEKKKEEEDNKAAIRLTWIGLGSDVLLFGSKGIAGIMSGSAALIADALHSGSDLASGFVTLGSLKLARKPPDKKHPYGYGHYETLGSLGVSALLFFGSISGMCYSCNFLYFAVTRDQENMLDIHHVPAALICCTGAVLIKEILFRITNREAVKQNSPVLFANAWHHRSDSFSSFAAFIGITGFSLGYPIIDPLLGFAVGGVVLKTSFDLAYTAVAGLTDRQRSADEYLIAQIETMAEKMNKDTQGEIRDIHSIKARRIGNYILLDLSVVVHPKLSVSAGFHAASRVRQKILRKFPEVKDVSTRIQTHSHINKPINREGSMSETHGNPITFDGRVSDLKTRSHREIENDIRIAVNSLKLLGYHGVKGVSHCSVHFKVSEGIENTSRRELLQKVEVNLIMKDNLKISEARITALAAKEEILKIPDIHAVDIHVELI